jgi:hypothetical protein
MLISDAIKAAQLAGKLTPAKPVVSWAGSPRVLLMCEPLVAEMAAGRLSPDEAERARFASLEADFSHFIEGGYINDDLMKPLQPLKYEHWELRSRKPRPSLRVFGRFAMPDVFVATHLQPRSLLGGMWSDQFEREKLVCEDNWKAAGLPAEGFFTDAPDFRFEAYITENATRKVRITQ